MAEQGFAGIGTNAWQGMFAPAATPKPVVDKLYGAVAAVLTNPEMKEDLAKQMMSVELSKSPQEFTDLVRRETQTWADFLREAKIAHRVIVEKDLEVPLRDGARLRADVFRPKKGGRYPVIINIGSYQKDKLWVPPPDLEEAPNPHMNWETVNPLWWVPRGYACLRVDGRGSGKSPGRTDPFSPPEARDFCDAIEWAGRQPWCNGRVGATASPTTR